jgi:MoaA/NifB/PqqE/SkfB family radical SAM enzyme
MELAPLPESMIPRHGTLLLTWACNSRCLSCKIWEIYKDNPRGIREELSLEDYARLVADPLFKNITNLGLAGGEPLMRPDLVEIMRLVPQTVQLFLATNALTLGRLKQVLPEFKRRGNVVVQISIDGIGELHDRVRGVPGNYDRCLQVMNWLVEMKIPRVVSSTLSPMNYHHLPDLYRLAQNYGAGFAFRTANKGDFYDNVDDQVLYKWQPEQIAALREEITPIVEDQVRRGETTDATGVFWNEIPKWLDDSIQMPSCLAAYKTFLLDPVGEVYPCPSWWHSLGNVKRASFGQVWRSQAAGVVRAEVDVLKCGGCWNDCTWPEVLSHEPQYVNPRIEKIRRELAGQARAPSAPISLVDQVTRRAGLKDGAQALHPGVSADSIHLAYGWHQPENLPPVVRWTKDEAAAYLAIPLNGKRLGLRVLSLHPDLRDRPIELRVTLDEVALNPARVARRGWETLWFDVPESRRGKTVKVTLRVDRTWTPLNALGTADSRSLGVAVEKIWSQ